MKKINELDKFLESQSQNGEEAFIEYILSYIGEDNYMVELLSEGERYFSNIRYFADKPEYTGLIISPDDPDPKSKNHRIIRENVIPILRTYQCPKRFDALSIDLNGNDYWVLDEVLTHYRPRLVVAEFNCSKEGAVSIQYDSNFKWAEDDFYGFSFEAGKKLAEKHGYYIVFQNDDINLYMVEKTYVEPEGLPEVTYNQKICFKHNPNGVWINV